MRVVRRVMRDRRMSDSGVSYNVMYTYVNDVYQDAKDGYKVSGEVLVDLMTLGRRVEVMLDFEASVEFDSWYGVDDELEVKWKRTSDVEVDEGSASYRIGGRGRKVDVEEVAKYMGVSENEVLDAVKTASESADLKYEIKYTDMSYILMDFLN